MTYEPDSYAKTFLNPKYAEPALDAEFREVKPDVGVLWQAFFATFSIGMVIGALFLLTLYFTLWHLG